MSDRNPRPYEGPSPARGPEHEPPIRRRTFLLAALAGTTSLGLAACGGAATTTATVAPASSSAASTSAISSAASTALTSASQATTASTSAALSAATTASSTTASAPVTASSASATTTASSASAMAASTSAAATSPGKAQVSMQFEHFFTGTLWDNGFKPIVALFEQQNPNIKWDGLAVGYGDMLTKLTALVAGGVPPDGTSASSNWVNEAAVKGMLQAVDDRIAKDKNPAIADMYPARLANNVVNGKQYGLPIDMGTSAVYYNKDLFDAAGVAYPKPGWTWDDLWAMAGKLTQQKSDHKQFGFQYSTDLHWLYPAYGGLGGTYFDQQLTKATFDTASSESALQTLLDARVKTNVTPYGAEAKAISTQANGKQPFTLGLYGMEHNWIGLIAYLHDKGVSVKNWDVAPVPKGPAQVQIVGGQGFAIVAGAKRPDEAWAWNTFMVSDEVQKMLGVNGVWFPARKSMAKFGVPTDGQPTRFVEAFYDPISTAGFSPWWYVPGWQDWSKTINDGLSPAWNGQASANDVAAKIVPTLDSMLKNKPKV
jgi:multiple sugar transport system substrate-binding protein